MDGVTTTTSELNLLSGSSAGTVVNDKAVIYSSQGGVVSNRHDVVANTVSANSIENVLTLSHTTDGTASNGIGVGMSFKSENNNNEEVVIGKINGVFTDVTEGNENGELRFQTISSGSVEPIVTVRSSGLDVNTGKSYSIDGTSVLSANELHSTVTTSSLTSVGTLTGLTVNGEILITGSGSLNVENHNGINTGLKIGNVLVTSSAEELNIMDGVTSTTSELNLLSGSSAGTVVNDKAVIYSSQGGVVSN